MGGSDWIDWHAAYEDPGSAQSHRVARIRARIAAVLDALPAGPVRVLSMCAGQGRDLIPVLAAHPRGADVQALLVELDPVLAAAARTAAREAGLAGVRVVVGDAADTSSYSGVVPVDLALVCGVFGNIPDDHVRRVVHHLPGMLAPGGTVIWTRHRHEPDLTPAIGEWFAAEGFRPVGYDTEPGYHYGVGTHVLAGATRPFVPGVALFRFEGDASGRM